MIRVYKKLVSLSDDQQILAIIRSLIDSSESLKANSDVWKNIKMFDDISHQFELEVASRGASHTITFLLQSKQCKSQSMARKTEAKDNKMKGYVLLRKIWSAMLLWASPSSGGIMAIRRFTPLIILTLILTR